MPFTVDEFFGVFARYNEAIWPVQVAAYLAGAIAVGALWFPSRRQPMVIMAILATLWAINGIGYHSMYFSKVNPAANVFAAVFITQAVALMGATYFFPDLRFKVQNDAQSIIGLMLIGFSTLVYPLWGWLAGHVYPSVPAFGVAPCPTTIFTIGILLVGPWRAVRWLLILPVLWAGVGGSAAVLLSVPQDYGLIAAMLIVMAIYVGRWLN